MVFLTAISALIGSRVTLFSGKKNRDGVPCNLNTVITGDSSADKSVCSNPIVKEMNELCKSEEHKLCDLLADNKKSQKDAQEKKEAELKLRQNLSTYYYPLTSFSPESITKHICNQEPRAGILIHRDEMSGLFQYKKWSGGSGSTNENTGVMDEFQSAIMDGHYKALHIQSSRVSDDKEKKARDKTLSVSGCLQNRYLSSLFNFGIDSDGQTARWIFVRARAPEDLYAQTQRLSKVSPIGRFMEERAIPFLTGIRPQSLDPNTAGSIVLEFDDEALTAYEEIWERIQVAAGLMEKQGIEPAFAKFRLKGQIRIVNFALLLHLLDAMEGARTEYVDATPTNPFAEIKFNGQQRIDSPISLDVLKRAINLEKLMLREYQYVVEDAISASFAVEKAHENTEERGRLGAVLNYIMQEGVVNEADLKKKIRTRSLSSKEISRIVLDLARRGCIERIKLPAPSRTFQLAYVKTIRG